MRAYHDDFLTVYYDKIYAGIPRVRHGLTRESVATPPDPVHARGHRPGREPRAHQIQDEERSPAASHCEGLHLGSIGRRRR